jgi:Ca-activated chloride channel homolog
VRGLVLIAAASVLATGAAAQEDPGTGALLATIGGERVELPVASVEVELTITGTIVRGTIEQKFENPADERLDATYVFPLPEGAAVDGLSLTVGGRRFAGEIREREEAKATFERARAAGRGAGLVEQHRPNLFKTSVAGIPPRDVVTVQLTYLDDADWEQGAFSTTFPLTITPRYAPGGVETPISPRAREARVRVVLDAGVPLEKVVTPSRGLVSSVSENRAELGPESISTDRDFVLRWTPRQAPGPVAGVLVEQREDGRYFSVTVVPPALDATGLAGMPAQTVFVVDVSGSMQGPSMEQAKEALVAALARLRGGDTFTLVKFSAVHEAYSEEFLPATQHEIARAQDWVRDLSIEGGTEILPALVRGLELSERGDPSVLRRVVLITDGAVDNEDDVVRAVSAKLGESRLHVVGIGPAPNRWLMRKLAESGRGTVEFIGSISEVGRRTDALLARTERAVVTGVVVEGDGASRLEIAPDPIPDLYDGAPLVITGRIPDGVDVRRLSLQGSAAGGPVTFDLPLHAACARAGIGTRWARARVESLEDARRAGADPALVRRDVVDLAMRFGLVTPYTSFVVVENESPSEEAIEELPSCGTLAPLLLDVGAMLAVAGLAVLGFRRLARGTLV